MRRDRLYLLDVVRACQKIIRYVEGKTFEEFELDEVLFDAVVRNLQIIGEAVRCIPAETRELSPEVEWTRIVALRHILVHHYFGLDSEIIWDLATKQCKDLEAAAETALAKLPQE